MLDAQSRADKFEGLYQALRSKLESEEKVQSEQEPIHSEVEAVKTQMEEHKVGLEGGTGGREGGREGGRRERDCHSNSLLSPYRST